MSTFVGSTLPVRIAKMSKSNPVAIKASKPKEKSRAPVIEVAKMIKGRSNLLRRKAPIIADNPMTTGRIQIGKEEEFNPLKTAKVKLTPPNAPTPNKTHFQIQPDIKAPTTPAANIPTPMTRSKLPPKLWACRWILMRTI